MEKRKNIITFAGTPMTLVGKAIKVGQIAPDFKVIATDLSEVTLKNYEGKVKVLSIVPSLDTGVCDAQTRWFNQNVTNLSSDVVVLTISMDLPFAQKRYCGANGIENVVTLSDYRYADFGQNYGCLIEELRLLTRTIVILDKDNTVKYVQYVPEVTTPPDYDKAVASLKSLL